MDNSFSDKKLFRIQLFAVAAGLLVLTAKFAAYFLTHSNTILSDALESIVNVLAGSFALFSLYVSALPKDKDHPYGHGKVEFVSAGVEGILIIVAGGGIIVKAIAAFFHPVPLENLNVGLIIITVSGIINFLIGFFLERSGKKHGSVVLIADGKHLMSDAYSSLGILVGVGLIILTGWSVLDNVVAIIIGLIILVTGIRLVRKSVAGIMDEADEKVIEEVIKLLNEHRQPQWIDVHNLRIIQYGSKLHVDCHATLPWYYTLEEAHKETDAMAQLISDKYSSQVEFFIHTDPCIPASCKLCSIADCKVRQEKFVERIEWNIENVLRNKRHGS
ncbi:MAG: cation transporter [Chitinophagales bacterium]|nr:cation transporter [Chitinophagales bacterium]